MDEKICSTVIENVGRMRLAIEPFSDECPVIFEDGQYIQMRYKLNPDGNGKILVSILRLKGDDHDTDSRTKIRV